MEGRLSQIDFIKEQESSPIYNLEGVKTPQDFLNKVHFPLVNELVDTRTRRAKQKRPKGAASLALTKEKVRIHLAQVEGVPETAHGWVDFKVTANGGVTASYPQESWKKILEQFAGREGIQALHVLIHEYVHIRAGVDREYFPGKWKTGAIEGEKTELDLGFTSQVLNEKNQVVEGVGYAFNEAMTEEIALQLLGEYLQRTNNWHFLDEKLIQRMNRAYRMTRYVLNSLIEVVAERRGVARDVVWQELESLFFNGKQRGIDVLTNIAKKYGRGNDLDPLVSYLLNRVPKNDTPEGDPGAVEEERRLRDEGFSQHFEAVRENNPEALERAVLKTWNVLRADDASQLQK